MADEDRVAQGIFYALFKVVEVEELSGSDEALAWARMVIEDEEYRASFAAQIVERTG